MEASSPKGKPGGRPSRLGKHRTTANFAAAPIQGWVVLPCTKKKADAATHRSNNTAAPAAGNSSTALHTPRMRHARSHFATADLEAVLDEADGTAVTLPP